MRLAPLRILTRFQHKLGRNSDSGAFFKLPMRKKASSERSASFIVIRTQREREFLLNGSKKEVIDQREMYKFVRTSNFQPHREALSAFARSEVLRLGWFFKVLPVYSPSKCWDDDDDCWPCMAQRFWCLTPQSFSYWSKTMCQIISWRLLGHSIWRSWKSDEDMRYSRACTLEPPLSKICQSILQPHASGLTIFEQRIPEPIKMSVLTLISCQFSATGNWSDFILSEACISQHCFRCLEFM